MAVMFKSQTLHGSERFMPGISLAFADAAAEPYFIAAGFADATNDTPLMTYPEGTVVIDPATTFADGPRRGELVMEG